MRFLILGNEKKLQVREQAELLAREIPAAGGQVVLIDLNSESNLEHVEADVALVLGGDGAILRASRQMNTHQIPVLGINYGRLGFLADLSTDEVLPQLKSVVEGRFRLCKHLMFECEIEGNGKFHKYLGLNEVVIRSSPPFHMVDLSLSIDGEEVSRFLGDGIIVSTPIGSTAYSLAAGGPILSQELPVFVITQMCGHTLTYRPLVDSAQKTYSIRLEATDGACVVIDGQELIELASLQTVTVRKSAVEFQTIKVGSKTYYRTLRDKLNWGTTPNYRGNKLS
ncbi:NAD(+)/NADH kinase [Telmatocola sphagniphila]|uniref:NAD kinase n=1 Tax=Telmatocola sphagniphila TaxID=1123043 RepID=A0A8E6BAG4_9BACT|nr:NAD(+)/NADH kinase [Telmatocola sphagniphila]QVL34394.1 NAD(+)/NADH kinase [Telmatocola sphagniphila]